jgi:hypothetical protein
MLCEVRREGLGERPYVSSMVNQPVTSQSPVACAATCHGLRPEP